MRNEERCHYCGRTLSDNNVICAMEFGVPCEEQIETQLREHYEQKALERMWREHEEFQRRHGEID